MNWEYYFFIAFYCVYTFLFFTIVSTTTTTTTAVMAAMAATMIMMKKICANAALPFCVQRVSAFRFISWKRCGIWGRKLFDSIIFFGNCGDPFLIFTFRLLTLPFFCSPPLRKNSFSLDSTRNYFFKNRNSSNSHNFNHFSFTLHRFKYEFYRVERAKRRLFFPYGNRADEKVFEWFFVMCDFFFLSFTSQKKKFFSGYFRADDSWTFSNRIANKRISYPKKIKRLKTITTSSIIISCSGVSCIRTCNERIKRTFLVFSRANFVFFYFLAEDIRWISRRKILSINHFLF